MLLLVHHDATIFKLSALSWWYVSFMPYNAVMSIVEDNAWTAQILQYVLNTALANNSVDKICTHTKTSYLLACFNISYVNLEQIKFWWLIIFLSQCVGGSKIKQNYMVVKARL